MKKLKIKVGIDKSKLIKGNKRLVACGKNFENVLKSAPSIKIVVASNIICCILYMVEKFLYKSS